MAPRPRGTVLQSQSRDVEMASQSVGRSAMSTGMSPPRTTMGTYSSRGSPAMGSSRQRLVEQSGPRAAVHEATEAAQKRINIFHEFDGDYGLPRDLLSSELFFGNSRIPRSKVEIEKNSVKEILKGMSKLYGELKMRRSAMAVRGIRKRGQLSKGWYKVPDFFRSSSTSTARSRSRSRSQAQAQSSSNNRTTKQKNPSTATRPSARTGSTSHRETSKRPRNWIPKDDDDEEDEEDEEEDEEDEEEETEVVMNEEEQRKREKHITEALVPILESIITFFPLKGQVIDCQERIIKTRDSGGLKPDIFIAGGDDKPRFPENSANELAWEHCYMPIEVKTDVGRKKKLDLSETDVAKIKFRKANVKLIPTKNPKVDSNDIARIAIPVKEATAPQARGSGTTKSHVAKHNLPGSHVVFQIASYVREIFAVQPHRRWVPALLFTETSVEIFIWDRAGVFYSERLDYHKEPEDFIRMFGMLLARRAGPNALSGFDPTMGYNINETIEPKKEQLQVKFGKKFYWIEETLVNSYTIRSQGTAYHLARSKVHPEKKYIIQDIWLEIGDWRTQFTERDFNLVLEILRQDHAINGLIPYKNMQVIETSDNNDDCIHRNRQKIGVKDVPNLVHCRILLKHVEGKWDPFDDFETPLELVSVLYDIVQVCHKLYRARKIVHRNIRPWNILLHSSPSDVKGALRKGYLVDFNKAVELRGEKSDWKMRRDGPGKGAYLFMSSAALLNKDPSPLDDMESIYNIILFVVSSYNGKIDSKFLMPQDPDYSIVAACSSNGRKFVSDKKIQHFDTPDANSSKIVIQLHYENLTPLIVGLYGILRRRYLDEDSPGPNAAEELETQLVEVDRCFKDALSKLKSGTAEKRGAEAAEAAVIPSKRQRTGGDNSINARPPSPAIGGT
ncbi:hypothetical protein M422DRAFT_33639 [Sphaerobolus stellatus SS14]|uniref:Unplaced genomic scaffold SPHSTscaffold_93, whole genome shotgun sequence n=1 Tax=Sphaerobolus stellatus (strain SS14) TaxID=990650 RepID=A0A0C9URR8_SPHS4|nr:hypothetical protein M422DRAFT_33639 [Sphaerobolus stellatus SS14]